MNFKLQTVVAFLFFLSLTSEARDLGFRFKNGTCVDAQGQTGLNPSYIGQCGDLRQVSLSRFDLDETDFSGSDMENADLQTSTLRNAILTSVNLKGANLSGVAFNGTQFKKVNFSGAILINAHFADAQFEDINFSGADMTGINLSYARLQQSNLSAVKMSAAQLDFADFTGSNMAGVDGSGSSCKETILNSVDLTGANFSGASFLRAKLISAKAPNASFTLANFRGADLSNISMPGSSLISALFDNANLTNSDLSGTNLRSAALGTANLTNAILKNAAFNKKTTLPFTKEVAESLGMSFTKYALIIIWDENNEDVDDLITFLGQQGIDAVKTEKSASEFTNKEGIESFTSVLHLSGNNDVYTRNVPEVGQEALVNFVKSGGTYIGTQWISFMFDRNNFLKKMEDLVILTYETGSSGETSYSIIPDKATHPLLNQVTDFKLRSDWATSKLRNYQTNPSVSLMKIGASDAVAYRLLGNGKIVNYAFAASRYNSDNFKILTSPMVKQLILNAILW